MSSERVLNEESLAIPPSGEFAWLLGFISAGGSGKRNWVGVRDSQYGPMSNFRTIGENVFLIPGSSTIQENSLKNPKHSDTHEVRFYSRELSEFCGDLRYQVWPETIINKHTWIYTDEKYQWQFLSGFFDKSGYIGDITEKKSKRLNYKVEIHHGTKVGCSELLKMLVNVGVVGAAIIEGKGRNDRIRGVGIHNWEGIRKFALNVKSSSTHKDENLKIYRDLDKKNLEKLSVRNEAYQKVMELYKVDGLSAQKIFKHPDMVKYEIPFQTISSWVYEDRVPSKRNLFKYVGK